MDDYKTFEEFLAIFGRQVWRAQTSGRNQRNHSGGWCPQGASHLIGGPGACDECESDFVDLLLKLYTERRWSAPKGRSNRGDAQASFDPAA